MKKTEKWKPDFDGSWVTYATIGFGQTIYVLYVPNHITPIGLVWGFASASRFEVAGSYVEPWARRFGVRSKINEAIFLQFKCISTQQGSKNGGSAFLKARGYKRNKDLDLFYLKRQ